MTHLLLAILVLWTTFYAGYVFNEITSRTDIGVFFPVIHFLVCVAVIAFIVGIHMGGL